MPEARVEALALSGTHTMSKPTAEAIDVVAGEGVVGDAHRGQTVKHRSRVAKDPTQPNLRQVHLIHAELHDELREQGFDVAAGEMGENVTTRGLDLLGLPTGAQLRVGPDVVLEVTGLRNPCGQLNGLRPGLLAATRIEHPDGSVTRKAGIMCIARTGGLIEVGATIRVEMPQGEAQPLEPV